ncbi:AbiH family protein [Myroides fluvii]|uniref:AbiH family protein n=1 Tax=Myroides fluvii TaxID=2572594 RepID=UPI00131BE681|nr:AbiH family protein [Myroides fluvii]
MKINRIVLIGNGFDLAHGLKTTYGDFCNHLINKELEQLKEEFYYEANNVSQQNKKTTLESSLILITNITGQRKKRIMTYFKNDTKRSPKDTFKSIKNMFPESNFYFKNSFFGKIALLHLSSWIDIEELYFKELIQQNNEQVSKLNEEFDFIKKEFELYLKNEVIEKNEKPEKKVLIESIIKDIIKTDDITISFNTEFVAKQIDFMQKEINLIVEDQSNSQLIENLKREAQILTEHYNSNDYSKKQDLNKIQTQLNEILIKTADISKRINKNREESKEFDELELNKTIFLNFNYTNTHSLYSDPNNSKNIVVNIHGEVSNSKNPIIFGYGDERDDEFDKLLKKNNNFLKNIKSYWYLNNDNYRTLLSLLDENKYQIIILGLSCGVSDRVLLSTLFEHKNCISIKPYFYANNKNKYDNYQDTVMNISRSFVNKINMRELVVNKSKTSTYSIS